MLTPYPQSREQSAVLLKLVIAKLGQHDAPFAPRALAVWYETLAATNPALIQALTPLRERNPRLGTAEIEVLDCARTEAITDPLSQLLKRVADGPGVSVARVGGEEFAVLLADATASQATQLAQAVLSLVRATKIRHRGTQEFIASMTISAGVAAGVTGDDGNRLIAAADAALVRSKYAGRDRVTVA